MQELLQAGNDNGKGKRKIIIKKKSIENASTSLSFRLIDFNIYDQNVEAQTGEEEQQQVPH